MKVETEIERVELRALNDVNVADIFFYDNGYYMRIVTHHKEDDILTVNLETGCTVMLKRNLKVIRMKAIVRVLGLVDS